MKTIDELLALPGLSNVNRHRGRRPQFSARCPVCQSTQGITIRQGVARWTLKCEDNGCDVLSALHLTGSDLPPLDDAPGNGHHAKLGADDAIKAGVDLGNLPREELPPTAPHRDDGDARPAFYVAIADLKPAAAEIWKSIRLVNEPSLFRRAGLVWLERDDERRLYVTRLDTARLRHWLTQRIFFWKENAKGEPVRTMPPTPLLAEILATPDPTVPIVTRILTCPIFASDGTLHEREGYDPRTRAWLDLPPDFIMRRVPSSPSRDEIAVARSLLLDVFADFPFVSKEADLAHTVAVILTILARELFDGPAPLTVFTKPAPGTGATLCAKAAIFIPTGAEPPVITQADDEAEWRKRITSSLLGAPAAIFVDNLRGAVDSAALSAALTSTAWDDRILGRSEIVHLVNRAAWVATANNALLSTELVRRTVRAKFDAHEEQPWRQTRTFKHPDLLAWIRQTRADLVHAALVLIAAWLDAGRKPGDALLPSFEGWSATIGGILAHAEIRGFLGNLDDLYSEQDAETDDVKRFLHAWWAGYGDTPKTTTDLATVATSPSVALPLGGKDDTGRAVSLGHWLRRYRGRAYDLPTVGTVIITKDANDSAAARWRLVRRSREDREDLGGSPDSFARASLMNTPKGVGSDGYAECDNLLNPPNPPVAHDQPCDCRECCPRDGL